MKVLVGRGSGDQKIRVVVIMAHTGSESREPEELRPRVHESSKLDSYIVFAAGGTTVVVWF